MALRGTSTAVSTAGAPVTVNMPPGTVQGDLCLLFVMSASTGDRILTENSGTWNKLLDQYVNGSTDDVNAAFFRKIQGVTPDTSVTVSLDTGSSQMAAVLVVWDGADLSSPEDVPIVVTTGTGAGDPDSDPITTITDGAVVVTFMASSENDAITNPPTGYGDLVDIQQGANISVAAATKTIATAGVEDPGAWADIAATAGDCWLTLTYAIRPESLSAVGVAGRMLLLGAGGRTIVDPGPTPENFLLFDEFRIGDISQYGFVDIHVVYESAMVAPGDADTDPPDPVYLDGFFQDLRADLGDIRLCLDYEQWMLISASGSATGVNLTALQYYITLVNAAKAHFTDVGLYGELSERYTGFLTGSPADNITRLANWKSRAIQMQPLWDIVDTVYPSFYFINPVDDNEADRDLWYSENLSVIQLRAPGRLIIPFMWPRIHSSVNPNIPFAPGPYWRSSLESLRSLGYDGFAGWMQAGDTDPRILNPVPDWWTETVAFAATV